MNWPVSFQRPEWLWLMLTIPVVVVASLRYLRGIERTRRIMAIVLRSVVIALLAITLAQIEWVRRNDHVAVMFVLDRSRSITDELQNSARQYIRNVTANGNSKDRVGVVGFDGKAQVDVMTSQAGFKIISFGLSNEPDRTDVAAGIRMAMAAFPEGFSRRIVLMSDFNHNTGDLEQEIRNATANNVPIDVIPLDYRYENEVLFDRIVAPTNVGRDTKVPVRMILKSQKPTRARIALFHNGQEVPIADPVLNLTGNMQPNQFTVPIELHQGGVHRFEASVVPIDPLQDSVPQNNHATAFTFVESQGRVLVLGRTPDPQKLSLDDDAILVNALKREKVDVDYQTVDDFKLDLLKLQEYAAVILSNTSADSFNSDQQKALASYVRDFGGGLVMVGGEESFGAGGWIGTPVEEVSPVSFEIKQRKQMPRGALAIILHSCEAPNGNYLGIKVAEASIKTISSLDYIGIIALSYNNGIGWEVPLQVARNKPAIITTLNQIQIGDMPDFDPAMSLAIQDMMKLRDASQRHMIIISDGDPSPPTPATIKAMKDNRITCSTVGIGFGSHVMASTMQQIAKDCGGRYYGTKNPDQLPQIFVKEARVVKRSLIDNEEFTPAVTSSFDELISGLSSGMPKLGGLVITERKPDALVPLIRHGESDGSPVEDPVLAHWNYQMGKMAVFTSGLWTRWGSDWASWGNFGKFWAQVTRWAMSDKGEAN
ncbi:MAG: VWA domain-containing protein, partial [Phycisphaerae bacterium]|nr:VWA domain-containing protein [Phycisphaerae bacterium]